jgi:hypothetical protein
MNESEAKSFIADEVDKPLWQRLVVIGWLFGTCNPIGLLRSTAGFGLIQAWV